MQMLTGGTLDVKPQLLVFTATQSAADTTTSASQPLPVLRNFSSSNGSKAQIIEILKVQIIFPFPAEVDSTTSVYLSTKNFAATATTAAEPTVFATSRRFSDITTSGAIYGDVSTFIDLSDGNGNGLLVATDNIYCQVVSTNTGVANSAIIRLLYRVYGASVTEYVGIVQGQQ
jgi:hypothetical protein